MNISNETLDKWTDAMTAHAPNLVAKREFEKGLAELEQPVHVWVNDHVPTKHDPVNSPSHYTSGGIECIDAMQAMLSKQEFIGYLRGNVMKYQWRYQNKNGLQDLNKAQWYLNKLVEVEGASND